MRIIQENVLAGVRLEFRPLLLNKFVVNITTKDSSYCFQYIENAYEKFDKTVSEALHTQTEKTMSPIDLENPPASMVTEAGSDVIKIGEIKTLEFKYVLQIIDGDKNPIVFSNRDVTKTRDSYRQSMGFSIQRAPVKKTGWVHVYPNMICSGTIFHIRQDAENSAPDEVIDVISIAWEE